MTGVTIFPSIRFFEVRRIWQPTQAAREEIEFINELRLTLKRPAKVSKAQFAVVSRV